MSSVSIQTPTQHSSETLLSTWSTEDSTLLQTLRYICLNWDSVAAQLPGRSATSCRDHYDLLYKQALTASPKTVIEKGLEGDDNETVNTPRQLPSAIPKSHWSREDDARLTELAREGWRWGGYS